uniref:Acyl-CoA_dh_N domain-containing protein n=1 Tax=Heterorhabditis bacteriophora TaxID=37862 RepID=A0A1I7WUU3_HETBA
MSAIYALRHSTRNHPHKYHMLYNEKHFEIRSEIKKLIDRSINPYVSKWEELGKFPAHAVFKQLGQLGALAVNKPEGCCCHTIHTTARRSGDDLIINGRKMWITNGAQVNNL